MTWCPGKQIGITYLSGMNELQEYTWANMPTATQDNKFLTALCTDVTPDSPNGFCEMICTGTRWIPRSGYIPLGLVNTQVAVGQNTSNEAGGTRVSVMKLTLPFSANNGNIMQDGDYIVIWYSWERTSALGTQSLRRIISAGTSTTPASNTALSPAVTPATNQNGFAETIIVTRKTQTNIAMPGKSNIGPFVGSSTNVVVSDAGTTVSNMDSSNFYIDLCPVWSTSNASPEVCGLNFATASLYFTQV